MTKHVFVKMPTTNPTLQVATFYTGDTSAAREGRESEATGTWVGRDSRSRNPRTREENATAQRKARTLREEQDGRSLRKEAMPRKGEGDSTSRISARAREEEEEEGKERNKKMEVRASLKVSPFSPTVGSYGLPRQSKGRGRLGEHRPNNNRIAETKGEMSKRNRVKTLSPYIYVLGFCQDSLVYLFYNFFYYKFGIFVFLKFFSNKGII